MNIIDYLESYKDLSLKEAPFNELDAAIFSCLAYFPFDLLNETKKSFKNDKILSFIDSYYPGDNVGEHIVLNIKAMSLVLNSKRFKGIKFTNFEKKRSDDSIEQFQAVTIEMKKFTYVSFSGTDATTLGWREDFNMGYLDIVPSEVDAIRYINKIRKKHPFKPIYIGGHSKGGRLAVRAGKEVYKKNTLVSVFSFDGPNFTEEFYDETYEEMKHLIYEYAPNESIVGRLITDRNNKIIVQSDASFIYQHSLYTWLVDDNHFIHEDKYTDRSNKIALICHEVFTKYDNHTKSVFVNTLFDLFDRLNITELKDTEYNKQLVLNSLSSIRVEWKNIPKESRKVIVGIIFTIVLLAIKRR